MLSILHARRTLAAIALCLSPVISAAPAFAQSTSTGPTAIDADLVNPGTAPASTSAPATSPPTTTAPASAPAPVAPATGVSTSNVDPATAYQKDDLVSAAEGVFGKGAKGLAEMIEKVLKDQGRPNAYIAGREASGAFFVGLRYGSGTMMHKVEGPRKVYWTGPSLGFDVGGNASSTFVLVYNLYDTQDIFKRFPAAEGTLYFIGGFTASYLRSGDIVLIPIRLGVGWRAGISAGYMKFSQKSNWVPF